MSKHHLRKNKECQNCGTIVEERYCTHCGQENTETRQSFGHLVRHFFEDLTHYDSGFWRTMKYLLFRPAFLTKEFLSGRRMSYVPPVRLYIFVSFLFFFLPSILPQRNMDKERSKKIERSGNEISIQQVTDTGSSKRAYFRTDVLYSGFSTDKATGQMVVNKPNDYVSVAQMDSMQQILPEQERYSAIEHWMAVKTIKTYEHNTPAQVAQKFGNNFEHNLSKALFIYMPLFAIALWIFHSRKKWLYFDHAIFTLHYFSFMLLLLSLLMITLRLSSFLPVKVYETVSFSGVFVVIFWMMFYFFRAHRKTYGESWLKSTFKSLLLFFINCFFIVSLLIVFSLYNLYMLH